MSWRMGKNVSFFLLKTNEKCARNFMKCECISCCEIREHNHIYTVEFWNHETGGVGWYQIVKKIELGSCIQCIENNYIVALFSYLCRILWLLLHIAHLCAQMINNRLQPENISTLYERYGGSCRGRLSVNPSLCLILD